MIEIALGILLAWFLLSTIGYWLPFVWGLIKFICIAISFGLLISFLFLTLHLISGV